MRVTLNIDDDVHLAARELASRSGTTLGRVISDLARKGMRLSGSVEIAAGPYGTVFEDGWYVLPRRGGQVVTKEMVDRMIEEADIEDAAISLGGANACD